MINKLYKKAVSPIIAIVLIVIITVVMGVGLLNWSTGFQEDSLGSIDSNSIIAIQIDTVRISGETGEIYVKNLASKDLTLNVDSLEIKGNETCTITATTSETLTSQKLAKINFTITSADATACMFEEGKKASIFATTDGGSITGSNIKIK